MFRELFSSDLPYYILDRINTTEEDFLSEIKHTVEDFSNFNGDIDLSADPACFLHLEIQNSSVISAQLTLVGETTVNVTEDLNNLFFSGYETRQPLKEEDFLDPESEEFAKQAEKSNLTALLESGKLVTVLNKKNV